MGRLSFAAAVVALASLHLEAAAQADTRAVPTYEAVGLYWSNPGATALTGCEVQYRAVSETTWRQGLPMWLDLRNNECRGSVVNLDAGTDYQVALNLPGQPTARTLSFRTWSTRKPVARTVVVPSGSGTLNITQGGTAAGYVVYQGAPGAVLDANNAAQFNVNVNASYVIVRGFLLRGAQQDAIRISPNVSDVVIEDNEITNWGRLRTGSWGVNFDSGVRAICQAPTLERVTIQRNRIHDPRYGANSWSDGHPEGPQAVTFSYCGGNHVIRHNEMFTTTGRYFNDIIGGEDNFSTTGFPNADSDIYGNELSGAWDDAIEAEGGDRNVRIWGNYIDQTGTGIATTVASIGPVYLFRNVYNRSRILEKSAPDQDDRQVMFKAGSDATLGDGRRYVFHNTTLQARDPPSTYGLGAAGGISGTGSTQLVNNTVSRNNIFHNWRSWTAFYDVGVGNDFANDLFNGTAGALDVGGIMATPIYAPGNGWMSESSGLYALAAGTPGYDQGARIPNFNDVYADAAPDIGAAEAGLGPMRFGLAASPGPSVAPAGGLPSVAQDFNDDGRSDLLYRNASTGQVYRIFMNGFAVAGGAMVYSEPNTAWKIMGDADFNGDGVTDLLYRNDSTGQVFLLPFNNGGFPTSGGIVATEPNSAWKIVHTPDLDGDGKADILWWNASTGQVYAMLMNGTTISAQGFVYTEPNTAWKIAAVGDFAGSGKANQLVWRNASTGQVYLMTVSYSGGAFTQSGAMIYQEPNTAWHIVAAADFNGDGKSDLLWRNEVTGQTYIMLMNGTGIASQGMVYTEPNLAWKIVAQGDYNGDGKADLLWRNDTTGQIYMMLMDGLTIASQATVYYEPDTAWRVMGPWQYDLQNP